VDGERIRKDLGITTIESCSAQNILTNMVTIDSGIILDFPEDWQKFVEGDRLVFLTPHGENIIISASKISGDGSEEARKTPLDMLFQNGLRAAQSAASHPELRIIKPLAEDIKCGSLLCWTIISETSLRDAFFAAAVIRHEYGTLLLTFEAPVLDGAENIFRNILRMIHQS
jgi:hypothetical protein